MRIWPIAAKKLACMVMLFHNISYVPVPRGRRAFYSHDCRATSLARLHRAPTDKAEKRPDFLK